MKELRETIEMMTSEDYKERFKAEFWQTKIRYHKLWGMICRYESGELDFEPKCSEDLLRKQLDAMSKYLRCLNERARIEGIELDNNCVAG